MGRFSQEAKVVGKVGKPATHPRTVPPEIKDPLNQNPCGEVVISEVMEGADLRVSPAARATFPLDGPLFDNMVGWTQGRPPAFDPILDREGPRTFIVRSPASGIIGICTVIEAAFPDRGVTMLRWVIPPWVDDQLDGLASAYRRDLQESARWEDHWEYLPILLPE
jgi:hypothetical protein